MLREHAHPRQRAQREVVREHAHHEADDVIVHFRSVEANQVADAAEEQRDAELHHRLPEVLLVQAPGVETRRMNVFARKI